VKQFLLAIVVVVLTSTTAFAQRKTIANVKAPEEFSVTEYSSNKITPCVACIGVAPTGEVFAGVDRIGSLGKGGGKGTIVKLIDTDHDGVADKHVIFATIDNPRGIVPIGDKVYVLHTKWGEGNNFDGMFLSVLTDADGDDKADGPPQHLVKEISTRKFNQARGVDHTTNGIRMGIDGWIYIAVGDFGFVDAIGTDGTKLTMYGGGVVRVRPDGTELETYVHGLRNIYDVSIDPFMNLFTRGNTNDGGGWNIRFIHEIQSAEYGYPVLFKRYTDEILPALVDVGGGSGTGSMFFQEPGWPEKYNNVPMMCDWGRGQLFIHRVTPDGASFTQTEENFIGCGRITDVDCDGSGRLFLGSWSNSGFSGGNGGYVARVTPVGWKYTPFPNLKKLADGDLAQLLDSPSAKARLHAQQALLERGASAERIAVLQKVAENKSASHEGRVAAIFALKQLAGPKSHDALLALTKDAKVAEHAFRALADRKTEVAGVPVELFVAALKNSDPRVQVAAAIGLGRLGQKSAIDALLSIANPPTPTPLPKAEPSVATTAAKGFQSKIVRAKETVEINLDITGYKQLFLVVGDAGNGDGEDHGSWFEPTLITKSGERIKLTDLKWKRAKGGWGKTLIDKNCTGRPLVGHDGKPVAYGIGTHSHSVIQYDRLPADVVRFQAVAGLANSGSGAVQFFVNDSGQGGKATKGNVAEGPHAVPNSAIILPHVAVKSLVALDAAKECVDAIGGSNQQGALWALRHMHNETAANGLIAKLKSTSDSEIRQRIALTLIRLIHMEKPYDGSTWWSTRPDTRGPYYYPTPWASTDPIKQALLEAFKSGDRELQHVIATLTAKDRAPIEGLPKVGSSVAGNPAAHAPIVDLENIKNQKGEIARMGVEDVIIALGKVKGDPTKGEAIFKRQGCLNCHTLRKGEPLAGPFMGQIGSIMKRDQIAMSILRPNATISQGFKSVLIETDKGKVYNGFVTKRLSDLVEIRDNKGKVTRFRPEEIEVEKILKISMMPEGLTAGLSVEEFASLVRFLEMQKK
jgi:putative heme-binding domain-containing protein